MSINPIRVDEIFRDCLFRDDELTSGAPADAVIVESVTGRYGFQPSRLAGHAAEVATMLAALPVQFQRSGGGGWSFLNACTDADGELWTGEQRIVDQLLALGIATGQAEIQMSRELWDALPGGVPYFVVGSRNETVSRPRGPTEGPHERQDHESQR